MKFASLLLLLFVATGICRADTLLFTFSGTEALSFTLSSTPQPLNFDTGEYVVIDLGGGDSIQFINATHAGGYTTPTDGSGFVGAQLYTGPESAPIFAPGVFTLAGFSDRSLPETVTITSVASTPEPSSFTFLATGLMGLAGVAKRRLEQDRSF